MVESMTKWLGCMIAIHSLLCMQLHHHSMHHIFPSSCSCASASHYWSQFFVSLYRCSFWTFVRAQRKLIRLCALKCFIVPEAWNIVRDRTYWFFYLCARRLCRRNGMLIKILACAGGRARKPGDDKLATRSAVISSNSPSAIFNNIQFAYGPHIRLPLHMIESSFAWSGANSCHLLEAQSMESCSSYADCSLRKWNRNSTFVHQLIAHSAAEFCRTKDFVPHGRLRGSGRAAPMGHQNAMTKCFHSDRHRRCHVTPHLFTNTAKNLSHRCSLSVCVCASVRF